ncbi:MAG TPA: ABC transporter substrate-binding protein [Oxalicibacterium sp.]
MQRFIFSILLLVSSFASSASHAQEAPDKLIQRVTTEVMAAVRENQDIRRGDQGSIQRLVEQKIVPHLDFERTTSLATGPYWRQATPQQRQQLQDEFRALLMHTYSSALAQVRNQKITYDPLRATPDETDVVVSAHAANSRGEPVNFGYRLIKRDDGWKVYDVNVLGVWMIQAYRQSFAEQIRQSGIDGLIKALADKNRALASKTAQPDQGKFAAPVAPTPSRQE